MRHTLHTTWLHLRAGTWKTISDWARWELVQLLKSSRTMNIKQYRLPGGMMKLKKPARNFKAYELCTYPKLFQHPSMSCEQAQQLQWSGILENWISQHPHPCCCIQYFLPLYMKWKHTVFIPHFQFSLSCWIPRSTCMLIQYLAMDLLSTPPIPHPSSACHGW